MMLKGKHHVGQAQRIFAGCNGHARTEKLQFIQFTYDGSTIVQFKTGRLYLWIELSPKACDFLHDAFSDLYQVLFACKYLSQSTLCKVRKL